VIRSNVQTEMSIATSPRPLTEIPRAGFTLIEVLIGLGVVSVGMLGVAGLYVHGIRAGRSAIFSLQAVTMAGDVADRIRANPRAGVAYAGTGADNGCIAGGPDCDAARMAEHDVHTWTQQAATSLPGGSIHVGFNGGTLPPEYTITVHWTEPGQDLSYAITIPVLRI
jgi:type IV pilus assembly protein PilV